MRTRTFAPALVLAAAIGCGAPDGTGPAAGSIRLSHAAGTGPVVTGSGHTNLGLTEELREFTFHAVRAADGSAKGSYKIERTDNGQYLITDVTCASVSGDTAWVGGIIAETNIPIIVVGSVSYFFAVDNGEGAGGVPDRISLARINDRDGEDILFCTQRPALLPTLAVAKGNVQVR